MAYKTQKLFKKKGLLFSVSPFDISQLSYSRKLNIDFFKVASTELEDHELIREIAKTKKKPTILSGELQEYMKFQRSVELLRGKVKSLALLHTVSIYPPKINQMNLNMIKSLKSTFHLPTGFSDHTVSHSLPAIAVALGACIIEKHITLK